MGDCRTCRDATVRTYFTWEHALADGTVTDFGEGDDAKTAADRHKRQVGGAVRKRRHMVFPGQQS